MPRAEGTTLSRVLGQVWSPMYPQKTDESKEDRWSHRDCKKAKGGVGGRQRQAGALAVEQTGLG